MKSVPLSVAAAATVLLVLAGCSSASAPDPAASGSTASAADTAELEAFLDESMQNPDSIGYDQPVQGEIPAGKTVSVLETPVAVALVTNGYREQALDMIGWKQSKIVVGNGPEDAAKAMSQGLDTNPAALFQAGYDPNTLTEQLTRAEEAGVPVVVQSIPFVMPTEWPAIVGLTRNLDTIDRSAKMTAAFLTLDSGGAANVELFSVPTQTSIVAYVDSLKKYLAEWCPGCSLTVNDFEYTDIGTNLPGQIVSAVQRNPAANYVVLGLGDASVGVVPALESAGLAEQVKIGGAIPSPENYEALRAGTQAFWVADASPLSAYRDADMMVRASMGEDITVLNDAPEIQQLLTPENVGSAVFDDEGYWLGYDDYVQAYEKQWKLG